MNQDSKIIRQIKKRIRDQELLIQEKDLVLQKEYEQKKQQVIQEKKAYHQLNMKQLQDHQNRYEIEQIIKQQEREQRSPKIEHLEFTKSRSYQRVQLESNELREQAHKQYLEKQLKKKKQSLYSELIQSIIIKPSKPTERKQKAQSQYEQSTIILKPVDKYIIRKLEKILDHSHHEVKQMDSQDNLYDEPPKKLKIPKLKNKSAPILYPLEPVKTKPVDYLSQLKNIRKVPELQINRWKSIMDNRNLTFQNRYKQTMEQVKQMERQSQKLEAYLTGNLNLDMEKQYDEILLSSLNAKVALL